MTQHQEMDHNSTQFGIVQTIDSKSIMEHSIALLSIRKISYLSWWFAFYLQSKYVQNISLFDQRPFSSSSFPLSFFGGGGGRGRGGLLDQILLLRCTAPQPSPTFQNILQALRCCDFLGYCQ